jgi:hypothetical protein
MSDWDLLFWAIQRSTRYGVHRRGWFRSDAGYPPGDDLVCFWNTSTRSEIRAGR